MALGRAVALLVVLAACSTTTAPLSQGNISAGNHGGAMEGHTPRGFAGSGTGLFVGDNLNPQFPEDDGVQAYLTFDLNASVGGFQTAVVDSAALVERGQPFEDLGPLTIEAVRYERFGPDLFDLGATSATVLCKRDDDRVSCDVSGILDGALDEDRTRAQFRLRLTTVADGDGAPDLAAFFRRDANTNEPGLFTLVITP